MNFLSKQLFKQTLTNLEICECQIKEVKNVEEPEDHSEENADGASQQRKARGPLVELVWVAYPFMQHNILFPVYFSLISRQNRSGQSCAARTQRRQSNRTILQTFKIKGCLQEPAWKVSDSSRMCSIEQIKGHVWAQTCSHLDASWVPTASLFSLEHWCSQTLELQWRIEALYYWSHWIRWCSIYS